MSSTFAAAIAAALSGTNPHRTANLHLEKNFLQKERIDPAVRPDTGTLVRRRKGPSERDERVCRAICPKREDGTTNHRMTCRVGIHEFNQLLNNRQVRRAYARIMAKREKSRG